MQLSFSQIFVSDSSGVIGLLNKKHAKLFSYSAFSLVIGALTNIWNEKNFLLYYFSSWLGETPATKDHLMGEKSKKSNDMGLSCVHERYSDMALSSGSDTVTNLTENSHLWGDSRKVMV